MGAEAEKVFAQLTFGDDERDKYDVLVKKLDDYCTPKVNVIHERSLLHSRVQRPDENIECYVHALYDMSARANFPDRDEAI